MRRYSDPIEVRSEGRTTNGHSDVSGRSDVNGRSDVSGPDGTDVPGGSSPRPQAFIWRGRLYVVRQVIGHWRERRAWWREALDPVPGQPVGLDIAAGERQVWRVEASPGQVHASGIFDLVHDDVSHEGHPDWRLVRVAD